jgi:hypothetical protein
MRAASCWASSKNILGAELNDLAKKVGNEPFEHGGACGPGQQSSSAARFHGGLPESVRCKLTSRLYLPATPLIPGAMPAPGHFAT